MVKILLELSIVTLVWVAILVVSSVIIGTIYIKFLNRIVNKTKKLVNQQQLESTGLYNRFNKALDNARDVTNIGGEDERIGPIIKE